MQVNRKDFINVLTKIKPGLTEEGTSDQTSHFMFNKEAVFTYNEAITVSHIFKTGIQGTVHAEELYSLLKKMDDEKVSIGVENKEFRIKGKKVKAGLKMVPKFAVDVPFSTEKLKGWAKLPPEFFEAARFCSMSASTDPNKTPFTSLFIEPNQITSCDNYRATRYALEGITDKPYLLLAEAAARLHSYDPVKYTKQQGWVHFQNKDKTTFSCRMVGLEYPDLASIFNVRGVKMKLPAEFAKVLERSEIMSASTVDLILEKGKITCRSQGDAGWIEETSEAEYDAKKISVGATPEFIRAILKHSQVMTVGDKALLFKSKKFKHVIALKG